MKISTKGRYALRLMVDLAAHGGEDNPVSLRDVAKRQDISDKYLEQYNAAGGDINALRRARYAENRDKINAQKRAAYAARKARSGPENVLEEYRRTATPGQGSITYDEGYNRTLHANEIKTAQWLHDHLGGDIVLLNEANEDHQKTADYLWRGKLWDLKNTSTEKAANSAIRHGIKQIEKNPGGIILDFGDTVPVQEMLWDIVTKRMGWYTTNGRYDILVITNGELVAAKRY